MIELAKNKLIRVEVKPISQIVDKEIIVFGDCFYDSGYIVLNGIQVKHHYFDLGSVTTKNHQFFGVDRVVSLHTRGLVKAEKEKNSADPFFSHQYNKEALL